MVDKRRAELDALKEADLKKKFELELANEQARRDKSARIIQQEMKSALSRGKRKERREKLEQEGADLVREAEEQRKSQMRHSMQQHNFQSYIMELEPRFARIGKLMTNAQMQFVEKYIVKNFSDWRVNVNYDKVRRSQLKIDDKHHEVPDIHYTVGVDEQGQISVALRDDFIRRFVVKCDEYGNPELDSKGNEVIDEEKEAIFQQALQKSVTKWLEQVETGLLTNGYFIHEEGNGCRAYPIAYQATQDGRKILDQAMVLDRYELTDCNCFGGVYAPKPYARPKPGKEPIPMLEQRELKRLMDSETDPTKSLNHFLENEYADLRFQHTPRLGM